LVETTKVMLFLISTTINYTSERECNKSGINLYIIKYWIEHEANIKKSEHGETPLFYTGNYEKNHQ